MEQKLFLKIKAMNAAFSRANGLYQKWALQQDVNYYLIQILYALYMESDITQKKICENYQVPKQTVNNVILSLKKQDYIELIPDENDKRSKKILFTKTGERYVQEMLESLLALDSRVAQTMGNRKYGQFIDCLTAYGDALECELKRNEQ